MKARAKSARARTKTALASLLFLTAAAYGCGAGDARKAEDAADARQTFKTYCSTCHGAEGEGRPIGSLRAPSFKSDFVVKLTDEQLYNWISRGGSNMPSFKNTLTEEQMRALVRHIREIQQKQ